MTRIVLHIGRPKTGTSAIQNALYLNRPYLEQNGYYYPGQIGHHNVMLRPLMRPERHGSTLDEIRAVLDERLFAHCSEHATNIVSAEILQFVGPQLVASVFAHHEVRVVSYVRNEIDYMVSLYGQFLQKQRLTSDMKDFLQKGLHLDATGRYLHRWHNLFGDRFEPHLYRPAERPEMDSVSDFFENVLALTPPDGPPDLTANPSVSERVLQLKLVMNRDPDRFAQLFSFRRLYDALGRLSLRHPGKLAAPLDLRDELLAKVVPCQEAWATRFFGRAEVFDYSRTRFAEPPPELTQAQIDELISDLRDVFREMKRERIAAKRAKTDQAG